MNDNGWIKIHRKLLDWEWADDPYMLCFWIRLLLTVNEKDKRHHGNVIKRGQLLTSIHQISDTLGWSRNTVKRILKNLSDCKQIKVESNSQGTLITVINFGKYQDRGGSTSGSTSGSIDEPQDSVSGSLGGSLGGSTIDPNLRSKEDKNINTHSIAHAHAREEKIGYEVFGKFQNVMLKPVELHQLEMNFGAAAVSESIEDLSCKLADGNIESINHYATLTYWLSFRKKNGTLTTTQQPKGRDLIGSNFTSD